MSMDTAMHDVGSRGHTLQMDLPRDWADLALNQDVWRGVVQLSQPDAELSFVFLGGGGPFFSAFAVGGFAGHVATLSCARQCFSEWVAFYYVNV